MTDRRSWLAGLLCVLAFLLSGMFWARPVYATSGGVSQSENIGTSMYDVSTALTAYANSVVGSNTNDKHASHQLSEMAGRSAGTAGAYVGYGDEDHGFSAYISANNTNSVTTSSYEAWANVGDGGATYAYVRYGHLLNDLGLDEASPEGQNGFRGVFGLFMRIIHAIAALLPELFGLFLQLLRLLNPFTFLTSGSVFTSSLDNNFHNVPESVGTNVSEYLGSVAASGGLFGQLAELASTLYVRLQAMGIFIVIPTMLALVLFSTLVFRRPGTGRKWLVLLERLAFMVVGIPICAVLYTTTINQMYSIVQDEPAASQLVGCTFVDFQSWITSSRLALPSGVSLVSSGEDSDSGDASTGAGAASANTYRQLRAYVFEINRAAGLVEGTNPIGLSSGSDTDVSAGMWNTDGLKTYSDFGLSDGQVDSTSRKIAALLGRYTSGDRYEASAWETAVNGVLTEKYRTELGATPSTSSASSNDGMIYGMYDNADDVSDWLDREISDNAAIFGGSAYPNGGAWAGKRWNLFSNGNLSAFGVSTDPAADVTYAGGTWSGDATDPGMDGGLSSIAMYNYLSTDFTDTSVSVYSAARSASEYTRPSHFSANLIGSGAMRFLFALNCVAVVGVFVLLGVVYGLGMVISNLKRGVYLIMQLPGAMLGVLRSIVQVIVYTIMMIAELIGTIFIYTFVCQLIIMFASIIETPIENAVANATVVIGGRLAELGVAVPVSALWDSTLVFGIGFGVVTLCVGFLGYGCYRIRRVVLPVYEMLWERLYLLATCPQLRPAAAGWLWQRPSRYVWDGFGLLGRAVADVLRQKDREVVVA